MEKLYELTEPQKSIWLTEEYYKGTSINNICGYVFIKDEVNIDILKKAINEVVKTNDSMKIKLKIENSECFQYISEYKEFNIETINLETKEDIERETAKQANELFCMEENLFKFTNFKLPNKTGGFIISVHHIIGDSWALGLIVKEITRTYAELLEDKYEIQDKYSYLNYIEAENKYKNSNKREKDKEYWEKVFETVPEIASVVPAKNEASRDISSEGERKRFTFSEKELIKIKSFCDNNKISVYNFFMAVYSLYIARVSGVDDFVMGTPILNRTNFEQKNTIGMFVSTSPLRIILNHQNTFAEFAKKVMMDTMEAFRHQKYGYKSVLEDLRKRDNSIPNLYNIILSYQATKTVEENSEVNYSTDWAFNGNSAEELQIHLFDLNDEDSMSVAYDYKKELFEKEDISNLHNRILEIINQIISNEEILLKDIEVVTKEEKNKILNEFNNTKIEYPHNKTIVDLFEEQVEKTPENIAVMFEDKKMTYKELNERANKLARYLVESGVKENEVVSILLDKNFELVISILAVLKTGACYVPIDTNYPENRIEYILDESKSCVLLTTSNIKYKSDIAIYVDEISTLDKFETSNLNYKNSSNKLAYIIYTSGSTGKPKGVRVSHKSLVNYIYWAKKFYCDNKPTNFPLYSSISFDLTITSIYTPLISGGRIIIYNDSDILVTLRKIFRDDISNIAKLTPAHLSLIQELEFSSTNIRKIIVGGDILLQEICKKITDKFKNISIYNEYGPTEATVGCMIYEYSNSSHIYKSVPIGKPIDNANIYILDKNLNIVPFGYKGEIYIGGDCLALGYTNSELNQNRFVENPFTKSTYLYKTGDLAILHEEDTLEYLGRNDFQIKINAFRIETGEITKNILRFRGIKDCFIDAYDFTGRKLLCAFYVSDEDINIEELKEFLSEYMPDYMIPKIWNRIDFIPLNINGKVNKKMLPTPSISDDTNIIGERNDTDRFILSCVKELLNLDIKNINSNIFEIGFDSLLAIKLAMKLSQKYGLNITVKEVFKYPTISEISDYINETGKNKNINKLRKVEKRKYYPLSSAQRRIYYASSMDTNSILYNISGGIIISKKLDTKKLEECFQKLVDRHEILRTHFNLQNNEIVQIIEDKIKLEVPVETESRANIDNIYEDFVKPFDLSKAPLLRAKIVKLEDEKTLILLDMHHIISDGASLNLFIEELCKLYNGNTLEEKELDYKDFTIWEKEQYEKEEFKKAKDFWVKQYQEEIPILNMPTSFPRPSVQSFEGKNYYKVLTEEEFNKINEISKKLNITPYMLMLSAYYILLSKYTSQEEIVVGTTIVRKRS